MLEIVAGVIVGSIILNVIGAILRFFTNPNEGYLPEKSFDEMMDILEECSEKMPGFPLDLKAARQRTKQEDNEND